MPLVLTDGPAIEPLTLAEAKAHLRLDGTDEDTLIASLIITSRLHVEAALGLALITQGWSYFFDAWPPGRDVILPLRPVQTVTAVKLYGADTSVSVVPVDTYLLDGSSTPARLVRSAALTWPTPSRIANGIEVCLVAGYGTDAASVPAPIRQAILLLVAHWYEHREPIEIGAAGTPVPPMVSDLLTPYRRVRL